MKVVRGVRLLSSVSLLVSAFCFGLMVLAASVGTAGVPVAVFGVYAYAFFGVSALLQSQTVVTRARRADLEAER